MMGSSLRTLQSLRALRLHQQNITSRRAMASKTSHEERTAADHREPGMHSVVLHRIVQANRDIRLLTLLPVGERPKAGDLIH